jgi:predicted homoserine dehydrogenase-like protein
MNVVANSTGMAPVGEALSYPLCRIVELADVFIPEQDGGILKRTGASWTCSIAPFVVAEFSISTPSVLLDLYIQTTQPSEKG